MPLEWIDIQLPFCRFRPSFRGMKSRGVDFFIAGSKISFGIIFSATLVFSPLLRATEAASEAYQRLSLEYSAWQGLVIPGNAKTEAERKRLLAEHPQPDYYFQAFLSLAEKNPRTPVALDSLIWIVSRDRQSPALKKALVILTADHIQSPRLGEACQSLVYAQAPEAENFLRNDLEKNPAHEVQGQAAMSLGQLLRNKSGSGNSVEAEKLFERVTKDFADVKSYRGTLGEAAGAQLFEIRNLSVGQVAPDIEGPDVDGKTFKLSEHRGKVVVLDFWGDW